MTDDIELLRRYVENGSEESFTELVERHVDFVYAAALRQSRSAHRAEDVAQAVFADLARKAHKLTRRRELVGWLYVSTHYAATAVIRSEARR
ncbi:MAG: sigma factor, partial [Opitutaceae bacterium]